MSRKFSYNALAQDGSSLSGVVKAANIDEAAQILVAKGCYVLELAPLAKIRAGLGQTSHKISTKDMNFFLIQLSGLIASGCPLLLSVEALSKQTSNKHLKKLLADICEKLESGKSFSDALKHHKNIFSNLFITMIEVGEVSGILAEVLEKYAHIHDTIYNIKKKLLQAMIYPLFLLVLLFFAGFVVVKFIFPRILPSHGNIPWPTQLILDSSNYLSSYWYLIVLAIPLIIFIFNSIHRYKSVARFFSKSVLVIPVIGSLIAQIQVALFSRILGTLLKCGVPILTSLAAIERVLSNHIYKDAILNIRNSVSRGESLSFSLGKHRSLLPESLILITDVGERGGNTGEMLERAGKIFEDELDNMIQTSVAFLPHLLVLVLAVFIFLLVLAVYLPLFDKIHTLR